MKNNLPVPLLEVREEGGGVTVERNIKLHRDRYQVRLTRRHIHSNPLNCGTFETLEAARIARDAAEIKFPHARLTHQSRAQLYANQHRLRKERRSAGLCISCGDSANGKSQCDECLRIRRLKYKTQITTIPALIAA